MNWDNVLAAGGAVAGCLAPLPDEVRNVQGFGPQRMRRRKYFHDEFLPGSDVDLFLYGLNEIEARKKMVEIFDAVQAASPFQVRAFRSTHAITLVSQYPFRHVQIVLRMYSTPSEVLMGFDVDSCAAGYDGSNVVVPPRTVMAIMTQSNTVDMSRRSPSYEMRLSKYANRGFEVIMPCSFDRDRVDPFVFEKRFDQAKGLSRLLLLEKLRTPEERLRYRIERQMKSKGASNWRLVYRLQQLERDRWNLNREEGGEGVPLHSASEMSDYSTIFLPWGPGWNAEKIERQMRKKDRIMNTVEIKRNGEVSKSRRSYKIHVCAVGTMEEVTADPFPSDPPIPDDLPSDTLEMLVRGEVSWLVDNPGRQQIGSFHPITDDDWTENTYFTVAAEKLTKAAVTNDVDSIEALFKEEDGSDNESMKRFLASKDFLGRSCLHLAALSGSVEACQKLLEHPLVDGEYLQARLPDGRMALHIAAMKGNTNIAELILAKRQALAESMVQSPDEIDYDVLFEVLDIDAADWENKLNPLQYAIALGQVEMVRLLLKYSADVRKVAVHKDTNKSFSNLALLTEYATVCGNVGISNVKPILELLLDAGASFTQVDSANMTCWHHLAMISDHLEWNALPVFLEVAKDRVPDLKFLAFDTIDSTRQTPLYIATLLGNSKSVERLLSSGASPFFDEEKWSQMEENMHPSSMYPGRDIKESSMLRCPIAMAAALADTSSLRAYCNFDKSLANSIVKIPSAGPSAPQWSPYEFSNSSQMPSENTRILDILQTMHKQAKKINESGGDHRTSHFMKKLKDAESKVQEAESRYSEMIGNHESGSEFSFQTFVWSLVVYRAHKHLKDLESQKVYYIEKDCDGNAEESIRQVEEAIQFIKEQGGEEEPKDVEEDLQEDDTEKQAVVKLEDPLNSFKEKQAVVKLEDPLNSFKEISFTSSMYNYRNRPYYGRQAQTTSRNTVERILNIFNLIAAGAIDELRNAVDFTKLCLENTTSCTTGLFLAVLCGNREASRVIFEGSARQYKRFVDEQNAIEEKKRKREEEMNKRLKNTKKDPVKALVNRINNLDIATGDLPGIPSGPDTIRFNLENAEAKLVDEGSKENETVSSIPPEALLLHRSFCPVDVPGVNLIGIKEHLEKRFPGSIAKDAMKSAVYLRPMELAIVKNDIEMLNELIALAESVGTQHSIDTVEIHSGDGSESVGFRDSDDESEYSDDSYEGLATTKMNRTMTVAQLRYTLVSNGSKNNDLGGLDLIELAIAMDNVDIFRSVVSFAKEFALPRRLIGVWKAQVDQENDTDCTDEEKKKRNKATQNIMELGGSCNYSLVHFILKSGAQSLFDAMGAKELDDILIDWLFQEPYKSPKTNAEENSCLKPFYDASAWVSRQIFKANASKEEVAEKLARMSTFDHQMRSSLFYAPVEFVARVASAGAKSILSGISFDVAKSKFLNTTTFNGTTALMVAAANGDEEKVKALLEAGCDRSICTTDERKWGVLHLVIENLAPELDRHVNDDNNKEEWRKVREMIEILLNGANKTDVEEMLRSPSAEHTPLMLAVSKGADEKTASFLIEQTALCAVDSLLHRDKEMNSALHLAVKTELKKEKPDISIIKAFIAHSSSLSSFENARGLTASDISLEKVLAIWEGPDLRHYPRSVYNEVVQGVGRGKIKPPRFSAKRFAKEKDLGRRAVFSLLVSAENGNRATVSFDDVKKDANIAAESARETNEVSELLFVGRNTSSIEDCNFPRLG